MKCLVYREDDSGLWVAEIPRITPSGVCVGWYREWFDKQQFAFAFASRGPLRLDTQPTE